MKDATRIRVHEPDRTGILVELFGEFDIVMGRALRTTVGSVARWGLPVFVDLSGVTFLDSSCLRELAVQHRLHANHLTLCNPSRQVELSVAACDLEGWVHFHPNEGFTPRATTVEPMRNAPEEEQRRQAPKKGEVTQLTPGARVPLAAPIRRRGPQGGGAASEDHRR